MSHNLQQSHQQDIQTITQVLAKITNRTPAQIKPLLNAMLKRLIEPQQRPFYETATPTEWSIAFQEWVDSPRTLNLPTLSDIEPQQRPFYETATPTEWSIAFQEWVDSHRTLNLPTLSDEAISRESIYGDRG